MKSFKYHRARNLADALEQHDPDTRFIAGGTNLLDLMKLQVETPSRLVDISRLDLKQIEHDGDGVRIGALTSNSRLAADRMVRERYPVLAEALLAGATMQLRNKATIGGNLLQRTRCPYFYDVTTPCNRRRPGSGCAALEGFNRTHAILGASDQCIAVHPSDMAVAMTALGARIETIRKGGAARTIPIGDLYRAPAQTPNVETVLEPGEIITAVILPPPPPGAQVYRKVRDRASYAFALVSVAVAGSQAALGGVAYRPWRAAAAEAALASGKSPAEAVAAELAPARGRAHNAFKIPLARRLLTAALAGQLARGAA